MPCFSFSAGPDDERALGGPSNEPKAEQRIIEAETRGRKKEGVSKGLGMHIRVQKDTSKQKHRTRKATSLVASQPQALSRDVITCRKNVSLSVFNNPGFHPGEQLYSPSSLSQHHKHAPLPPSLPFLSLLLNNNKHRPFPHLRTKIRFQFLQTLILFNNRTIFS